MTSFRWRSIIPFLLVALALVGCTSAGQSSAKPGVTIFAAASLNAVFTEMAAGFSTRPDGAVITSNFGGSNQLRMQVEQGAKADLFASADQKEMDALARSGLLASSPQVFARNRLIVILPRSNPGEINRLQDLARPGLKLDLAGPTVPVGTYTLQALDKLSADPAYGPRFREQVLQNLISQEIDVKQVVAKVQLGEADAGIVYSTDAMPQMAPDLKTIEIPEQFNVVATYPIAVLKSSTRQVEAQAFITYVLSPDGQAILKKHGFLGAS